MAPKTPLSRTGGITLTEHKSFPAGAIIAAAGFFRRTGLDAFLDQLKERGEKLSPIVAGIVVYKLVEGASLLQCGKRLAEPLVRKELGIEGECGDKTIRRAVELIGKYLEEIVEFLRNWVLAEFPDASNDVNIDTSSRRLYGSKSELGRHGYSREHRADLEQVNFGLAELASPVNIPIDMEVYKGNESDPVMFTDLVWDVIGALKEGSRFIMDGGGSPPAVLDIITGCGCRYLTLKDMNQSDDAWIAASRDKFAYVDERTCAASRTFKSSGRTEYIFFSIPKWMRNELSEERRAVKCIEQVKPENMYTKKGRLRKSNLVTVKKNPAFDTVVGVRMKLFSDDGDMERHIREKLRNQRSGFFKLESSDWMDPAAALSAYRMRASIERLIASMKGQIELGPIRAWGKDSVRGVFVTAYLAQLLVAVIRYEVPEERRLETRTIVRELNTLTVTYESTSAGCRRMLSNFTDGNVAILRHFVDVRERINDENPHSGKKSGI
jgi:hypothetical protein